MEPVVFKQSRVKLIIPWIICIVIFVVVLIDQKRGIFAFVVAVGLGLIFVSGIVMILRPAILTIDRHGFTIKGGLAGGSRTECWQNVSEFSIKSLPTSRGGYAKFIVYDYINSDLCDSTRTVIAHAVSGFDAGISDMWSCSQSQLLTLLNEYRSNALRVNQSA